MARMGERRGAYRFWSDLRDRDNLEDLREDGIILKGMLKK